MAAPTRRPAGTAVAAAGSYRGGNTIEHRALRTPAILGSRDGARPYVSHYEWDDEDSTDCVGTTKNGTPCSAKRVNGDTLCVGHRRSADIAASKAAADPEGA